MLLVKMDDSMIETERLKLTPVALEDIEIYTTHVPPGSSNGIVKVQHYEGLFKFLESNKSKKILSGDFNSPKEERPSGEVITWGQKINKKGADHDQF